MEQVLPEAAKAFFRDIIDFFGYKYPRLLNDGIGLFDVTHAFQDKIPKIEVLLEHDLLLGVLLKKSSTEAQPGIARKIQDLLASQNLFVNRLNKTYAHALPVLSEKAKGRPFIFRDHGLACRDIIDQFPAFFGSQFVGMTEHTENGDQKLRPIFRDFTDPVSFLSTARIDLKERSDRNVAQYIAREIVRTARVLGKDVLSCNNQDLTMMMVGYGMMGMHAAQELKAMGCRAELVVTDTDSKKMVFAKQDGYEITNDFEGMLRRSDIVSLATNVVQGQTPVLSPYHFSIMKQDVCIASMTSLDDEANIFGLIDQNVIEPVGFEDNGMAGIYRGPSGRRICLMQNGRPANVFSPAGGDETGIYLVEGAGLLGAFLVAHYRDNPLGLSDIPEEDVAQLCRMYLTHICGESLRDVLPANVMAA